MNRLHCCNRSYCYGDAMFHKWTGYTTVTAAIAMVIHGGGLSGTSEDHIQAEKLIDLARVGEVNPLLSGENDVSNRRFVRSLRDWRMKTFQNWHYKNSTCRCTALYSFVFSVRRNRNFCIRGAQRREILLLRSSRTDEQVEHSGKKTETEVLLRCYFPEG